MKIEEGKVMEIKMNGEFCHDLGGQTEEITLSIPDEGRIEISVGKQSYDIIPNLFDLKKAIDILIDEDEAMEIKMNGVFCNDSGEQTEEITLSTPDEGFVVISVGKQSYNITLSLFDLKKAIDILINE